LERIITAIFIYRDYINVNVLCQPSVENDLFLAETKPLLEGGKVKKAEVDRFLNLVHEVVANKNMGYVGFNVGDGARLFRIASRVKQKANKFLGGLPCIHGYLD
jgi:hypothetical protein